MNGGVPAAVAPVIFLGCVKRMSIRPVDTFDYIISLELLDALNVKDWTVANH